MAVLLDYFGQSLCNNVKQKQHVQL